MPTAGYGWATIVLTIPASARSVSTGNFGSPNRELELEDDELTELLDDDDELDEWPLEEELDEELPLDELDELLTDDELLLELD